MKSRTTERFRKAFAALPEPIRRQAKNAYKLFQNNPYHPGLHFKQVHPTKNVYSVRVNLDYRALGMREHNEMIWFWIGAHTEYERLIGRI